jgi:hypothetical protein
MLVASISIKNRHRYLTFDQAELIKITHMFRKHVLQFGSSGGWRMDTDRFPYGQSNKGKLPVGCAHISCGWYPQGKGPDVSFFDSEWL